ncbi:MAG: hypothetical protein HOV86_36600 [Thermoactinospora sp.]|nr:hypothetical protein [Thermoactinospora sp.]
MTSPSLTSTAGVRPFLVGMFVDALGNGLYVPLTLLFIHEVTRLPMTTVGLGVTVAAIVGLAANPVAGVLIDRFDARRVLTAPPALRGRYLAIYQQTWAIAAVMAPAGFSALLSTAPPCCG